MTHTGVINFAGAFLFAHTNRFCENVAVSFRFPASFGFDVRLSKQKSFGEGYCT